MLNIIKKNIKFLINFIKHINYKKNNIYLAPTSSFNRSIFSPFIKIHEHTQFNDSSIGSFSYVHKNCFLNNVDIGKFCSIAPEVKVIQGSHPLNFVSTSPVFYSTRNQCGKSFVTKQAYEDFRIVPGTSKSCVIGNDVWIGYGVKVIEGVRIFDGAVILAGAVVTKDVKPYSIVGGVPAKHIKYRFQHDVIEELLHIQWWNKSEDWLQDNLVYFYNPSKFLKNFK